MNRHPLDWLLPDYGRTPYLPYEAQASRDDLVAPDAEARIIFEADRVDVSEKVDGANAAFALTPEGILAVRNRNHILTKGYKANTPAKQQFAAAWTWAYEHLERFVRLNELCGGPVAVRGDWLYAIHSIVYTALPDRFIAFGIYDPALRAHRDPIEARSILEVCGFTVAAQLHEGHVRDYVDLAALAREHSCYGEEIREGVVVAVGDGQRRTHCFKLVRPGYVQGARWDSRVLQLQPKPRRSRAS